MKIFWLLLFSFVFAESPSSEIRYPIKKEKQIIKNILFIHLLKVILNTIIHADMFLEMDLGQIQL